jgi:GTP-binding protein
MHFVDQVTIQVESGPGGNGMVAWRREKYEPHGGPAGGDGGRGGDVILEASTDLGTLLDFQFKVVYRAEPGENGRHKNQHGRGGESLIIKVPCGTVVRDTETGQAIADLTEPGQQALVAQGGRGGRGNSRFISSTRQSPQFAEPGEPGIIRSLGLELKLIADVGLMGFPNTGKSTFISVVSAAKPKIADYPFTTLVPNLGVVRKPDGDGVVFADIPGLIEGASQGAGLGHAFLRHIERNRLLLHLVDLASPEATTPIERYRLLNQELDLYSAQTGVALNTKPQVVVLTKIDALLPEDIDRWVGEFTAISSQNLLHVFAVSSVARQGIDPLLHYVFDQLATLPKFEQVVDVVTDTKATDHDDSAFTVERDGGVWVIEGGKIQRLLSVTDLRNSAAVSRTLNIFKAMGVHTALRKAGAQPGDTVQIGAMVFEFTPELV